MSILNRARDLKRNLYRERQIKSINAILSQPAEPDTKAAERDFESLQSRFPAAPEYGYDKTSLAQRAAQRMASVLRFVPPSDKEISYLDVATGDGVIGALFSAVGYSTSLCDIRDWRKSPASPLDFREADCCAELPFPTATFDIVTSFNSFEHFPDPASAFAEICRVTKAGGLIYLDFGPLYCSPWGLHAYRTLRMPYPQFLFSPEFTQERLRILGMSDLGETRTELQYMNGWTSSKFDEHLSGNSVRRISSHVHAIPDFVGMVKEYPDSFRGRGLNYFDLINSNIIVAFEKI